MDPSHRKIELQSPADLTFLTSQIRTAARQKLNLHLPSTSTNDAPDQLRRSVEDLVELFVAQILQGMRHNISINGIDVVPPGQDNGASIEGVVLESGAGGEGESLVETVEYEAFDDKLRGQLSAMVARRDALVAKISQQRRTTPKVAAEAWMRGFEEESRTWEEVLQGEAAGVDGNGVAGVEALQRQEEVERNWEKAVQALQSLNKGLPETRARLERAGDVVGYLGVGAMGRSRVCRGVCGTATCKALGVYGV